MLSRVAESMFWMSRYIERAENMARSLDVNFHLLLDLNKIAAQDTSNYWEPLILMASDINRFNNTYQRCNAQTVTEYLVLNRSNPNSIYSCIALARENARSIIESISSEMWEQVNNLYHFLTGATPQSIRDNPYLFYRQIKHGAQLFQGITDCTLARNEGWDFVQAAKYLERADSTARLLDIKYLLLRPADGSATPNSADAIQWMAVLKSCSALESFRKVYRSKIEPDTILHYLLLDRDFPRSIYFSVTSIEQAMLLISGNTDRRFTNAADRMIGKAVAELSFVTVEDVYEKGLHPYLLDLQRMLSKVGEQIHQLYFAYHAPELTQFEFSSPVFIPDRFVERAMWSQAQQQQQQ